MAGVNKAILIGNLGRDPEVRYTPAGTAVASFSIATSERFTDKSGQRQERTEWHNIVCWSKLAEICKQYLKKGSTIYIEGRIQTRSWDKDGIKHYKTEIIASTMQMLGPRSASAGGDSAERMPADPGPVADDFSEAGFKPPQGPGPGSDPFNQDNPKTGAAGVQDEDLPF
jgi:single-strand DNA-binding protein